MVVIKLRHNSELVKFSGEDFTFFFNGGWAHGTSVALSSSDHTGEERCSLNLLVEKKVVLSKSLKPSEFRHIYAVLKPETNDELNILNRAEVKTADTDQVPAAGTNNAAIV
ncbi:hypothetical protein [Alteromonas sp. RKMC-009]|uniref:hypothetical protein n=1 Tax=Alteromonas sp. RKMC-009 TaxID=2267264 RepID=UPI000E6994DB|nr:hypothetical protein [Alteromonas sp. RKMC-009]AYA63843.1 hypothetical protein DS731_07415 [Alteromonas sp. RKMC-009]